MTESRGRIARPALLLLALLGASLEARAVDVLLVPRLSYGSVNYTFASREQALQANTTATLDGAGGELRLRPSGDQLRWTFEASFELEELRQLLYDASYVSLRGSARLSFGTDLLLENQLRLAPVIQVGVRQGLVVDLTGFDTTAQSIATRPSVAGGAMATYRLRTSRTNVFFESTLAVLWRVDTGGGSPYGSPLQTEQSLELELSGALWLTHEVFLEVRGRSWVDDYEWASQSDATLNDTSSQRILMGDLAVGFRF